jgi:hypothetical protein
MLCEKQLPPSQDVISSRVFWGTSTAPDHVIIVPFVSDEQAREKFRGARRAHIEDIATAAAKQRWVFLTPDVIADLL